MTMGRKLVAEMIGTWWLVLGGCGAAVLAGPSAIGFTGISVAFGLTVLTMAYALGPISGCHLNPAVTIGLTVAGRFPGRDVPKYVGAQVAGAILGALTILIIAKGHKAGYDPVASGLASNGYDTRSPAQFSLVSGLVTEIAMTFGFLLVILGATSRRAAPGFAGLAIGLALTLIHLISIPVTNTSVNPARSTGPALFAGSEAIAQLWLFWVAPIIGAALAGVAWKLLADGEEDAGTEPSSPTATPET